MSYVVHFRAAAGPVPSWDELVDWCEESDHFTVDDDRVRYKNENTEVELAFERLADARPGVAPFVLSLPVLRPITFAMEAGSVLERLVEQFWLLVEDAQGVVGGFDYAVFLEAWSAARAESLAPGRLDPVPARHPIDRERLEAGWSWNFCGLRPQDDEDDEEEDGEEDDESFLPHIKFALLDGRVQSYVTWTDLDAIVLPRVDFVIVLRLQTAIRTGRKPDTALVRWDELAPHLPGDPDDDEPIEYWRLDEAELREPFVEASAAWTPLTVKPQLVPMAHLLEADAFVR